MRTKNEQALLDQLLERAGWLRDYEDALDKYDSLSSGEKYIMRVLQRGEYSDNAGLEVDVDYARAVRLVLHERGEL